jgi:hypothetical protein
MTEQVLEELEFAGRQLDRPSGPRDSSRDEVHIEITYAQTQGFHAAATAQQCSNARDEFSESERFDEIVVGAAVQAGNSIFQCVARSQQKDCCLDAMLADAGQDLKAVAARQHDVENDDIELFRVDAEKASSPVCAITGS